MFFKLQLNEVKNSQTEPSDLNGLFLVRGVFTIELFLFQLSGVDEEEDSAEGTSSQMEVCYPFLKA